jgi:hypothetical protein
MSTKVLEMQLEAAKAAESIGLLDAVKTIAQRGPRRGLAHEWVNDWNGLRFLYGERAGDESLPYADVHELETTGSRRAKGKPPVHQPMKGDDPPADHTVVGSELLFCVANEGETPGGRVTCFHQAAWARAVIAEAERLRQIPVEPRAEAAHAAHAARFSDRSGVR